MAGIRKFIVKVHETGIIVDRPRHEQAHTVHIPENIEDVVFSRIKHFTHQFTSNFAKRLSYDALQSTIDSRIGAE